MLILIEILRFSETGYKSDYFVDILWKRFRICLLIVLVKYFEFFLFFLRSIETRPDSG